MDQGNLRGKLGLDRCTKLSIKNSRQVRVLQVCFGTSCGWRVAAETLSAAQETTSWRVCGVGHGASGTLGAAIRGALAAGSAIVGLSGLRLAARNVSGALRRTTNSRGCPPMNMASRRRSML